MPQRARATTPEPAAVLTKATLNAAELLGMSSAHLAAVIGVSPSSLSRLRSAGRSIEPRSLSGRVIIVPVLNAAGFGLRSIYISPLDGKNLNRVFPGNANGTASEQVADWIFQKVFKQATYYIDLHGGDLIEALVPFTIVFRSGNEEVDQASLNMAKIFGIQYLVRSETPGSAIGRLQFGNQWFPFDSWHRTVRIPGLTAGHPG